MAVNLVAPGTERANREQRPRRRPPPTPSCRWGLRADLSESGSWRFPQVFDRRDQSIATPSQGLDIPGVVRRVPQGTAEGLDRRIDALVEVVDRMIHPQGVLDFLAGDNPALTFYEHPQDLKYLFSQQDLIIRIGRLNGSEFARAEVELKSSESNAL